MIDRETVIRLAKDSGFTIVYNSKMFNPDYQFGSFTFEQLQNFVERCLNEIRITEYEKIIEDHKKFVRELDVLLNGEDGASEQASLCDIVAQVKKNISDLSSIAFAPVKK